MDEVEVSVVLPVFNEEGNLESLVAEIVAALKDYRFEIIGVDDGSADGSRALLGRLRERDPRVRVLVMSAHSGQSGALVAGFEAARGRVVAMLDADGQDDPADIPAMLEVIADGRADAAVGYRVAREDSRWKRFQSRVANAARNRITGDSVRDTGASPRVASRADLVRLPRFDGMHRFLPTLLRLLGRRVVELPVAHRPRSSGRSSYGMWDRLGVGLDDAFGIRWLRRRRLSVLAEEEDLT